MPTKALEKIKERTSCKNLLASQSLGSWSEPERNGKLDRISVKVQPKLDGGRFTDTLL
jgi:hypothetical protein